MFFHSTVPLNFGETFIREQSAILEAAKQRYVGLDYPALVRLLDAFLELDVTDQLNKIRAPTCVIAGEKDILKPVIPYSKIIHDRIPNSELVIVHDSGHAITFEKPKEFNTITLGFLQRQST